MEKQKLQLVIKGNSFVLPTKNNIKYDFIVDWGDGTKEHYKSNDYSSKIFKHEYKENKEYIVSIEGQFIKADNSFGFGLDISVNKVMKKLFELGYIKKITKKSEEDFIEEGKQIKFSIDTIYNDLFKDYFVENIEKIHLLYKDKFKTIDDLFYFLTDLNYPISNQYKIIEVKGSFAGLVEEITNPDNMFAFMFFLCKNLVKVDFENIFDVNKETGKEMFLCTFAECVNLSGEWSNNIFKSIYGAPKISIFNNTFYNCDNLYMELVTGDDLFKNIIGQPEDFCFCHTFRKCTMLSRTE